MIKQGYVSGEIIFSEEFKRDVIKYWNKWSNAVKTWETKESVNDSGKKKKFISNYFSAFDEAASFLNNRSDNENMSIADSEVPFLRQGRRVLREIGMICRGLFAFLASNS